MSAPKIVEPWPVIDSRTEVSTRIFSLRTDIARNPRNGLTHPFHILESPDWVNVIALTKAEEMVLIRQYRFGTREVTLEIPGGLIELGDTPQQAACRELREETGFVGGRAREIGRVKPNPAFLTNTCYTYLIEGVEPGERRHLDPAEDIAVELRPVADIPKLVASGEIDHALVLNAFFWFFKGGTF